MPQFRIDHSLVQSLRGVPVYYILVDPLTPLANLLPNGRWNPGVYQAWNESATLYTSRNTNVILYIPLLYGDIALHCASPDALRTVLNDAFLFTKPRKVLGLDFMGPNLVASTGEQWRRHRKITAPTFDNQTYMNVWEVTAGLYHQMLESEAWKTGDQHYFPAFNTFTTRLALLVIAACGFNMHLRWDESPTRESLSNPIDTTIIIVSTSLLEKMVLPNWVFRLPIEGLRRMKIAFDDFQKFLDDEVSAKKLELKNDVHFDGSISDSNKTVFGRVVAASQQEGTKGLDQREIIGNLFIFLFAGHETTAHTLVVTLAMLALNPGEQERVYQHIKSVLGDSEPKFDDYGALAPVLHCFYEALRLYPAAFLMGRVATADTMISASGLLPSSDTLAIPKNTEIVLDMIGASRHEETYANATAYLPRRWESSSDAATAAIDSFLGFSTGPRVCLGKKFATVEAVCFLTHVLRDWKVFVKFEKGETAEGWQKRMLNPILGATLKTGDVPLLLTRRSAFEA
ncbi:unnamed protein product [Somion occarium]|uniref:Cytochrome P450 n=1 Tax=Somion occarium TaxID=3059160 RepID=A0ABP1DFI5_9APHY